MAGTITHIILGSELLAEQQFLERNYHGYFMLGNCFPDSSYWPGKDSLFSDLSHYLMATRIPRIVYENSPEESWKAFSLGWLFHLQTDLSLHPLINRFAASYYYKDAYKDQTYTYADSKLVHALIENSLDRKLLRQIKLKKPLLLRPPKLERNPISVAIGSLYPVYIPDLYMEELLEKMPGRLSRFYRFYRNFEINKIFKVIMKSFLKLSRRFMGDDLRSAIEVFTDDYEIDGKSFDEYKEAVNDLIEKTISKNQPSWIKQDFNYDTGMPSRKGEYILADNLYDKLSQKSDCAPEAWLEFRKVFQGEFR